jgi:hypothetical protein
MMLRNVEKVCQLCLRISPAYCGIPGSNAQGARSPPHTFWKISTRFGRA